MSFYGSTPYQMQAGSWPWGHHSGRFPTEVTRRRRRRLMRRAQRRASGRWSQAGRRRHPAPAGSIGGRM